MHPLAIETAAVVGVVCAVLVAALALVVVAPWRPKHDGALDDEVQARLLLGEDPEDIDRDLEQRRAGSAPVAELRPDDQRS